MPPSHAEELLMSNLAVVERAVAFACRRYRLDIEDAEEFASVVKLKLVEDDYAVLRAFEYRSGFATYISVVVQRMVLDYRIHTWGKWHASAEAKRLGAVAIELEQVLLRDGRTLDEALTILAPKHDGVTRESLQTLAARLPKRDARRRDVDLEEAATVSVMRPAEVEERLFADDRRRESERVSSLMSTLIARLPDDERLLLQLRFEGEMSVAQIARALALDQKMTYRRIDRCMRDIRRELERSGVDARGVLDLIGRDEQLLQFPLGNQESRPSIASDERATAHTEGSQ